MYKGKKVVHIVARGMNGEIGANNKLLWNIPEDLRFFKESTIGHVVLMGRNTIESLPKPLPRRICMCVSTKYSNKYPTWLLNEALVDGEAYSNCLNTDKIFIAGGAKLFQSTFDITDELWITEVANDVDNCDTWYKIPKDDFTMFEHTNWMEYINPLGETLTYRFTKWVRNKDILF